MNKESIKRKLRIIKRKKWPIVLVAVILVAAILLPITASIVSTQKRFNAKTPLPLTDILTQEKDRERITLVAHRGYSAQAPENTLPAITKAAEHGFDYVEIDIRQTKDGVWVLMHDEDIKSVCDKKGKVSSYTYYDLVTCNVVRGANAKEYPDLKVPTLEQALKTCMEYNIVPMIEIKDYTPDGITKLLELVEKYGFEKSCSIISFQREALELVRKQNKEVRILKLVSKLDEKEMQKCLDAENMGVSFNGNEKKNTPEKIDKLREAGLEIACWTIDSPETMLHWVSEGVTTFVTNKIYYHN